MEFNDHFKRIHATIGSAYPIEQLAKIVNVEALGYKSREELYAPVSFAIQVSDADAIRLNVPVHSDENWYNNLCTRLASSMGVSNVALTTVTGKPLTMVDKTRLGSVGTLKLLCKGQKIVSVPMEYSFAKREKLTKWVDKTTKSLPDAIATELFKKDAKGVDKAIEQNGAVQTIVEDHMKKHTNNGDWNTHVRVHHVNPGMSDADLVLKRVSKVVLSQIRAYIAAASPKLKRYIAGLKSTGNNNNSVIDAPILGKEEHVTTTTTTEDGHSLYRKLVQDALASQQLVQYMIDALHISTSHVPVKKSRSNGPVKVVRSLIEQHNPWFAQIHHSLLPMRGTYPSDYLAKHSHVDMTATAHYPGNLDRTYLAFHLLSNRHTAPPGLILNAGKPVVNNTMKKVGASNDIKTIMRSRLVNNTSNVSGLVPNTIASIMRSRLVSCDVAPDIIPFIGCGHDKSDEDDRDEIGSDIAPDMIPFIGCGHDKSGSESDEDMRGAIGSDIAPDLIPFIGDAADPIQQIMRDRLEPISMHGESEDDPDEFAGLPTVDDVWK